MEMTIKTEQKRILVVGDKTSAPCKEPRNFFLRTE